MGTCRLRSEQSDLSILENKVELRQITVAIHRLTSYLDINITDLLTEKVNTFAQIIEK